jgi:hypothetical protein
MSNQLLTELDKFMHGVRTNPPEAELYVFLKYLSEKRKLVDYSEQDWVDAGRAYGMTDDEISNWVETAASWIDDTTENGKYEPEKSSWA